MAANAIPAEAGERTPMQTVRIYAYGVARNRLMQAAKRLGVPAVVVNDVQEAEYSGDAALVLSRPAATGGGC